MPLSYLDSSALVKLYLPEIGSGWVIALVGREPVAISALTLAEMASALGRHRREGHLSIEQQGAYYEEFRVEVEGFTISALTGSVVQQAAAILLQPSAPHVLRTLDALHIASARIVFERARRRQEAVGAFVSADRVLNDAARWAGLAVENPEDHP